MAIPFQFGHLAEGQNFINRQDEVKRLPQISSQV